MRSVGVLLVLPFLMWADRTEADFDPATDFSQYKTFAIRDGNIHTRKSELNNEGVRKKIEAAIRADLTAKGLKETAEGADVGIFWTLGSADEKEVKRNMKGKRGWRGKTEAFHYTAGTLVIDLHETETREVVYRTMYVDDENNAGRLALKIEQDVAKALEKYPPEKK